MPPIEGATWSCIDGPVLRDHISRSTLVSADIFQERMISAALSVRRALVPFRQA
jgi:hypothetical protein